jgi:hypothetical protein
MIIISHSNGFMMLSVKMHSSERDNGKPSVPWHTSDKVPSSYNAQVGAKASFTSSLVNCFVHHHQGMTLLISPLLSLMRDQIRAAEKLGLQAVTINSTNPLEHADIQESLENHNIDLLLISPERLGNNAFRRETWSVIQHQLGLIVVGRSPLYIGLGA